MKLNVTVDLDGFSIGDEYHGYSVEDAIVNAVAAQVLSETKKRIDERLNKLFGREVEQQVAAAVKQIATEALELGIQPMTDWGEPKGERVPFKKYLIERVESVLRGKVDHDGNPSRDYSSDYKNVIEWAANRVANDELKKLTDAIRKDVMAALNEDVRKKIIGDVVPAITGALTK